MLLHLKTNEEFKENVNKGIVLVDFFATWCGPCKMLSPILEQLAESEKDITVIKVDVDQFRELSSEYQIYSVPTLFLYKDGKLIESWSGVRSLDALKATVYKAR